MIAAMISVVIPTFNAESVLGTTLSALVPASVQGVVREVVICDGGSRDGTGVIAEAAGAYFIESPKGRGTQLAAGARKARFDWLLFLHADTMLETGWEQEANAFIDRVESGEWPLAAAAFQFALDDFGIKPRMLETMVGLRCSLLRFPYGDQGLLIPRRLYNELGGYSAFPFMEDVDLVRRLGRKRLVMLRSNAVTSAIRYRRDGYVSRSLRNFACLSLFYLRVSPEKLQRLYG